MSIKIKHRFVVLVACVSLSMLPVEAQMPVFVKSVFTLIDISVTEYIKRGVASLIINFGCTGGQHRSVYAAEALARHLKNKFKVKMQVTHTNKKNWLTKM